MQRMKLTAYCSIVLVWLAGTDHVAAQDFLLTSSPSVGRIPLCVIAADVNGSGKAALITANLDDNTLTVLTNNGNGQYTLSATLEVGTYPNSVIAADVKGKGTLDLICANGGDNTLTLLTNNGHGSFGSNTSYSVGKGAESLIAADLNGDGSLDLVCANFDDNTLTVLTNDGHGDFVVSSTNAVGRFPDFVAAADLRGSGNMDLISVNWGSDSLTVLTNDGFGAFGSNATYAVGSFPVSLAVADLSGAGRLDLVCANSDDDTLSVLTNNGNGAFVLSSLISTGVENVDFGPQSITAADLNGDRKVDLIFVDFSDFYTPGILAVLTNDGTGLFAIAMSPNVGAGPEWVVAADLNGDGKLDLITANHLDDTLSVLINVPKLNIVSSNSSVVVSWPVSWTNWTLQQNTDLKTTNWLDSGGISANATNKSTTLTSPTGSLFFRLFYP